MKTWAHVVGGTITNLSLWDGVTEWTPPEPCELVDVTGVLCGIGWTREGDGWAPPPPKKDFAWAQDQARQLYRTLPSGVRVQFAGALSQVQSLADLQDLEGIQELLASITPPEGYEGALTQLQEMFNQVEA